jgi:hypothetical protein
MFVTAIAADHRVSGETDAGTPDHPALGGGTNRL